MMASGGSGVLTILQSLRDLPRSLSDEENLYLVHLTDEIRGATSDAARWRIQEREGLNQLDAMAFDQDILAKLTTLRRAAMN